MSETIIAINLGLYNCVSCISDSRSHLNPAIRHHHQHFSLSHSMIP